MLTEAKKRWLRREISRLVANSEEAAELVLEIAATDWNEVIQNDTVRCNGCGCMVPYREVVYAKDSRAAYCAICLVKPIEHTCLFCKNNFMTTIKNYSYECGCRWQSKCVSCGKLGRYSYAAICHSCLTKRGLSDEWLDREYGKIRTHNGRDVSTGTLTLPQWITTLAYFDWHCAYCLTGSYEQMDHFVPLRRNGVTAITNCVPSCKQCNNLKGQRHPDNVSSISPDNLNRVRTYLHQFEK